MTQADNGASNTPQRRRRWTTLILGSGLIGIGAVILASVVYYYGFGLYGSSKLEDLNVVFDGPISLPNLPEDPSQIHGALMPDGSFKHINTVTINPEVLLTPDQTSIDSASTQPPIVGVSTNLLVHDSPDDYDSSANQMNHVNTSMTKTTTVEDVLYNASVLVSSYNSIYPGFQMHPKYWGNPFWAGSDPYTFGEVRRPDGFTILSPTDGLPRGGGAQALEIRIPAIEVRSPIKDLEVIDIEDSRSYETPNKVVGRIPTTAQVGETGNAWFFGHLESPIKGEGNVFQKLPEIPQMLINGDPVYISVVTTTGEYLYQVTETSEIHQDELKLYDTADSTITLVTCVPRLLYDHRILVTGKLVGVKKGYTRSQ